MNLYVSNLFNEIIPPGFSINEEWELKCYFQIDEYIMFMAYLNKENILYYYNFHKHEYGQITMHNLLYDFIWTTNKISDGTYPMVYIDLEDGVSLVSSKFEINNNENFVGKNDIAVKNNIFEVLSNTNLYFSETDYHFYFITYDKEPPNFKSGYSLEDTINYTDINNFQIISNSDSPLDFYYDFKIIQLNLIKGTKYAYYEIYNNIKNKTYH